MSNRADFLPLRSGRATGSPVRTPWLTWTDRQRHDRDLVHPAEKPRVTLELVSGDLKSSRVKLIHGDNRSAMEALLAGEGAATALRGSVKLCYLDPPYNTGSTFSTYSDSRSSVDWLQSLYDRLVLMRSLLAPDGSVWLHLDDSEQHRARVLLDEVFGPGAFVSTIVWEKRQSRDSRKAFSTAHDYIHVYAPAGPKGWKKTRNGVPDTGGFSNPDQDPRGPWRSVPMTAQAGHATRAQFYTLTTPTGVRYDPPPGRCWTYSQPRLKELIEQDRVYWPRNGHGRPRLKRFASEVVDLAPSTLWTPEFAGDTALAKKEILASFPGEAVFDTPKPLRLMERVISIATNPGDLVLDPYMGSGTTGIAATRLDRHFIGIEQHRATLEKIAAKRIRAELPESELAFLQLASS